MNTTHIFAQRMHVSGTGGEVRRSLVSRAFKRAVAPFAVILTMIVLAGPAQAMTQSTSGYTGSVVTGRIYAGQDASGNDAKVIAAAPRAYKASAYSAYNQYVCAQYRLWRTVGTATYWTQMATVKSCGWIYGSYTNIQLDNATWSVLPGYVYTGDITLTWQLSNGQVIGSKYLDYNAVGDYACTTPHCEVIYRQVSQRAGINLDNFMS